MRFYFGILPNFQNQTYVALEKDAWNDWFTWHTTYNVHVITDKGKIVKLGRVKIAKKGMTKANGSTEIEGDLPELGSQYFSLGQDENYYETLISLGDDLREAYLVAMRDCAFSLDILNENISEPVMTGSLLHSIEESRVRERLHRLATGRVRLTAYSFEYHFPENAEAFTPPPTITFSVTPNSLPATNIHVLIGPNGVGKSRCLDFLARAFLGPPHTGWPQPDIGRLINTAEKSAGILSAEDEAFAGLEVIVGGSPCGIRMPGIVLPTCTNWSTDQLIVC
ncbi:hypothetical protein [Cupriavidus necator]|uniref:hypothetical protein n=1 Tax=Cupriavidus necator TaxID=106590 RepID=UPI0012D2CD9D|nr:hypothetical protein [Cupriavidus necator]